MRSKERLFERPLQRPIDAETRRAVEAELDRRRHELPMAVEIGWTPDHSALTISSKWVNFLIQFTQVRMVVDAELTIAARMFATEGNRQKVIAFINDVADELKL